MGFDLVVILPEIGITLGGLALLVLPWIRSSRLLGFIALGILATAGNLKLAALAEGLPAEAIFFGLFMHDRFTSFFQLAILVSVGFVVLSIMGYAKEEVRARRETYVLLLLATVGLLLVVGAQHFVLLYIGLELVSVLSYLLVGIQKKESLSIEGALKYFLFGALATGAMLYGISLIYGLTGSMDLRSLGMTFPHVMVQAPFLATAALFLLVVGLGFKLSLVPFHMWAPDAYEGAPTPVAAFLSVGPKLAGFALLGRVFLAGFSPQVILWPALFSFIAVLTMTLGNVVALVQTNLKRLLAYSSIAHAGTMVIGVAVATPFGMTATLYYLWAYILMNMGAFVGVIAIGNATGREDIGAFAGLSRRAPGFAVMMTLCLLSLAGIPPLAGFFAKMWIFGAALQKGAVSLAVIAAINSVISVFYYMKIVKAMYLDEGTVGQETLPQSRSLQLALGLCTVGLFVVGLVPTFWLNFSASAVPVPFNPEDFPFF